MASLALFRGMLLACRQSAKGIEHRDFGAHSVLGARKGIDFGLHDLDPVPNCSHMDSRHEILSPTLLPGQGTGSEHENDLK